MSQASAPSDQPTSPHRNASLPLDVASAYFASISRIASWVVVSALVFRLLGQNSFAILVLVRSTIGLLNYSALGLAPAMITVFPTLRDASTPAAEFPHDPPSHTPVGRLYSTAVFASIITAATAAIMLLAYCSIFNNIHVVPSPLLQEAPLFALTYGIGMLVRLLSDPPGAILQTHGKIALDNFLLATGECSWMLLCFFLHPFHHLWIVGLAYVAAMLILWFARLMFLGSELRPLTLPRRKSRDPKILKRLLVLGAMITLAQAADYLYAPTDNILINTLIDKPRVNEKDYHSVVAVYAPAIQIDAGLMILVTGLASVIFPRSALAHAQGEHKTVRDYYRKGTLGSFALLTVSASVVYALSPWLFKIWMGSNFPIDQTRAILPLVLTHTIIGGSSSVGRSILLAIGKVRAFTTAVLIAGLSNVILSFCFVHFFNLGLKGIILGTICAVVGRCVFWMPWYVTRQLRLDRRKESPNQ